MQLAVLADEILKEELLQNGTTSEVEITWVDNVDEFPNQENVDGFIDLLFENTRKRVELLRSVAFQPVIINSVIDTLEEINAPFIRINAWPGFLKRSLVEASSDSKALKERAEGIF
jgi:3-hydroxybutyryl-CoA dehydrogenase